MSTWESLRTLATIIATVVGFSSGAYALWQNVRKDGAVHDAERASAEAKAEARRLADKAAAVTALENAVRVQDSVIAGLTQGLQECLERDNDKARQLNDLRTADALKSIEIDRLHRRIAVLEASR